MRLQGRVGGSSSWQAAAAVGRRRVIRGAAEPSGAAAVRCLARTQATLCCLLCTAAQMPHAPKVCMNAGAISADAWRGGHWAG